MYRVIQSLGDIALLPGVKVVARHALGAGAMAEKTDRAEKSEANERIAFHN
jgi:hypothetical protein